MPGISLRGITKPIRRRVTRAALKGYHAIQRGEAAAEEAADEALVGMEEAEAAVAGVVEQAAAYTGVSGLMEAGAEATGALVGEMVAAAGPVGVGVAAAGVAIAGMDYAYQHTIGAKRSHSGERITGAPTTPAKPDRPALPKPDPRTPVPPRKAGPSRRNFGPMPPKKGSGRGGAKRGPPRGTIKSLRKRERKQAKPRRNVKAKTKGGMKAVRLRKTGLNKSATAAFTKTQVHGVIVRPEVSWVGFQSHGGSAELFDVLADGILRRLLARFKIVMPSPDTNMLDVVPQAVPGVNSFVITLRRANADTDGTTNDTTLTVDLTPTTGVGADDNTYKGVVDTFASNLKSKAVDGYFPVTLDAKNSSGTVIFTDKRFGSAFIDLSVYTVLRMRNITPNDNGDDDMSKLSTNPIDGKVYTLNGDVPRLREDVMESLIQKFNSNAVVKSWYDSTVAEGINYGPQGTTYPSPVVNPNGFRRAENDIFCTPVEGKRVFQRVLGEKQVYMAPGTMIKVPMLFKHKGTLENLLKRFAGVYASPGLGTVKMFCLQQVFKAQHGVASGDTFHSDVKVEYEFDRFARCGCALAAQRRIPAEKRVVESSAGATKYGA
jgi:hypothetical protein